MRRVVVEQRRAEDVVERRRTGAQAVLEGAKRLPDPALAGHHGVVAYRIGGVGAQGIRQGCQAEASAVVLDEHAGAGQRPQHPVHRGGLSGRRGRNLRRRPGTVVQQVGDAEFGHDRQRLRQPGAGQHVGKFAGGRPCSLAHGGGFAPYFCATSVQRVRSPSRKAISSAVDSGRGR